MDLQLAGKVALVTGASLGLGRSIALLLAQEGCRLAIVARRANLLEKVADTIAGTERERPLVMAEDITAEGAADRIRDQVLAHFGSLDILVNNAGGSRPLSGLGTDAEWEAAMLLNHTAGRRLAHGPSVRFAQVRPQRCGRLPRGDALHGLAALYGGRLRNPGALYAVHRRAGNLPGAA